MEQNIKKTERAARPAFERIKKAVEILSPASQRISRFGVAAGMFFRALTAFIGTFGLTIFVLDAFTVELPLWWPLLFSAGFTLLFTLLMLGLIPCLGTLLTTALSVGAVTFVLHRPVSFYVEFFTNSVLEFYNRIMTRLDSVGYRSMPLEEYPPIEGISDETVYLIAACAVISLVFSLLLTLFTIRRVYFLPVLTVGGSVCVVIFTYNITRSNWGFTLILTALCGYLAMKLYDASFNSRPKKTERMKVRAIGGHAAFAAMLLAFLLLLLPTLNQKKSWRLIEAINDRMGYLRAVTSSLIIGDVPNLSDLGFIGNMDTLNARTTVASERTFSGKEMLRVQAAVNMPVYLRSWMGTYYAEDSWYSAMTDDVTRYREELFGPDFSPEDITLNILEAVNPKLVTLNNLSSYVSHANYGYLTMSVDVENLHSSGNVLFIPSMFNTNYGLLEHSTRDAGLPYTAKFKNYYEGIITTDWFNFDKRYRAVTLVPSYRDPDFAANLEKLRGYYTIMLYYIQNYSMFRDEEKIAQAVDIACRTAEQLGYSYESPSLIERFFAMNDADRQDFLERHVDTYSAYAEFVRRYYTGYPQSETMSAVYQDIFAVPLQGETVHDVVMRVIDYLDANYTYTLVPAEPSSSRLSALDAFLGDTKQGYCVQFATAAAMLLRMAGIPTRYVEGYIASEFTRDSSAERTANYYAVIRDYNAHAWIEVWLDNYGWMQYEVTPSYYDGMYKPLSAASSSSSSSLNGEDTEPEEEEDDSELSVIVKEEEENFALLLPTVIALGILVVIFGLIALALSIDRSARFARDEREKRFDRAFSAESSQTGEAARKLSDLLYRLTDALGISPHAGEFSGAYAERLAQYLAKREGKKKFRGDCTDALVRMFSVLKRAEFSRLEDPVTPEELADAAASLRMLFQRLTDTTPFFRRLYVRYIKRAF